MLNFISRLFHKKQLKIDVKLFKNSNNDIYSFVIVNHTESFVCASVSMLALNTINAIETFTDVDFAVEADEPDGGYLMVEFPQIKEGQHYSDVALLLNTLELGLDATLEEYPEHILIYKEVQQC